MATATEHYAEGERLLKNAERALPLSNESAATHAAIASAHFVAAQAAAMLGRVEAPDAPPDVPAGPFFSWRDNGGLY